MERNDHDMDNLAIFCADVGSIKAGKFGWAASLPGESSLLKGRCIEEFSSSITSSISENHKVALGFECPLFVPMRNSAELVNSARKGEGNRSWSAGAGTGALATGLVEALWVFNRVTELLGRPQRAEVSWEAFRSSDSLFLWEAFVSSSAKGISHEDDAVIAIEHFKASLPNIETASAIDETNVLSLIGAAALRAGWSDDIGLLSEPCVVIKA